ncbi:MAG: alpha/beta fold hydrolase [Desulfovibrio sp.]|nr:alpha/beta fold hydrolase [Desulfovibrio sp.]MBI4959229.1 alpha/beta fold hydrolase [Desulfovibrio sp.]
MAVFVLIHGAFTGGWIWGRTAKALRALGHDVHRPTLTGCGERAHLLRPEIVLAMHVEDVAQMLFHEDLDQAILVGHGYGGMIASAVAHRHGGKVAGVVHLDGVVPERGATFLEASGKGGGRLSARQNGSEWLVAPPPVETFGVRCREMARWLSVRLQPFPRQCLGTPYPYGTRDREKPCIYLRTTVLDDPAVGAQAARAALTGMRVLELATGPLPMVTNPGRLAKTLDSIVRHMGNGNPVRKNGQEPAWQTRNH